MTVFPAVLITNYKIPLPNLLKQLLLSPKYPYNWFNFLRRTAITNKDMN